MNETPAAYLRAAVHRNGVFTKEGVLERIFTLLFGGLVYTQTWEDPFIDIEALGIGPDDHILAVASAGCNVMNYLIANPARITAIDLNAAQVAFNRLKIVALQELPDHQSFFDFFGRADLKSNIKLYEQHVRDNLDPVSRAYWEGSLLGRRRIEIFAKNIYKRGLLGRFISTCHIVARIYGANPDRILDARSPDEQRIVFLTASFCWMCRTGCQKTRFFHYGRRSRASPDLPLAPFSEQQLRS